MIRTIKLLTLAILLSLACSPKAHAQTINAASCASAAVQTALNSVAADGATVVIPAGTCVWTSTVNFVAKFSITIQGQTTVTGTCGPGGSCTAADNTSIQDATGSAALHVTTVSGKSIRITGLSFVWSSGAQEYVGMLYVSGNTQALRIDHCHFYHANIVDLVIHGDTGPLYGVVDHNMFNTGSGNEDAMRVEHPNWSGTEPSTTPGFAGGVGNSSWNDNANWGSNKFVFVENNKFSFDGPTSTHAFAFDCDQGGGRMVFRYNNVVPNMHMQTHGTGSGGADLRSCRALEIYGNTFDATTEQTHLQLLMLEGGGLYFWGNTVAGATTMIQSDYIRNNNLTYPMTATPNGWGYCSASPIGGVAGPSAWDSSGSGPCLDQTGRGKGDLLTANAPNKVDSSTGTLTWPNQAYDPGYIWGNNYTPVPQNPSNYWSQIGSNVAKDRDVFVGLPNFDQPSTTFNGTSGVGCGPAVGAACSNPVPQPSTCTQYTGYWNPSTNTLYQCSSVNTWTAYYTPYTYPHPLTTGSGTPPAPPTGVQAIVN